MKVYFAGPLFSGAERLFNAALAQKIESLGIKVFLPQRDGVSSDKDEYKNMDKEKIREILFSTDYEKIMECSIFLFVLDGRVPDEGACFELGAAYTDKKINAKDRKIIGLQTDSRAAFPGAKLNPMIRMPFDSIFENEKELLEYMCTLC